MKSKKGTWSWVPAFILGSILLVAVLIGFLSPNIGLLNHFSNFGKESKSWLPAKEASDLQETKPTQKFNDFFSSFSSVLESATSKEGKCIMKYGKLDNFDGSSIDIFNNGKNVIVRSKNSLDQVAEQKEIKGINICSLNPGAFYRNYLDSSQCTNNCEKDYFDASTVKFTADELNGKHGMQDGGILYKPEKDKLCFIPTHKGIGEFKLKFWENFGCDAGPASIDNDCIAKIALIKECGASKEQAQLPAALSNFAETMKSTEKSVKDSAKICTLQISVENITPNQYISVRKNPQTGIGEISLVEIKEGIHLPVGSPTETKTPVPFVRINNAPGYIEGPGNLFEEQVYQSQIANYRNYIISPFPVTPPAGYQQVNFGANRVIVLIQKDNRWVLTTNNDVYNLRNLGAGCEFEGG